MQGCAVSKYAGKKRCLISNNAKEMWWKDVVVFKYEGSVVSEYAGSERCVISKYAGRERCGGI